MSRLRIGQVDYLNCLPVYHALEEGLLSLNAELVKGAPAYLNKLFLQGDLDVTPISSIEYARYTDSCLILPELSISTEGRGGPNTLFVSKLPVTELEGRAVSLTETSATSVVLLKVLFDHYYHVDVQFETMPPDIEHMMARSDGALLTGDDALLAYQRVKEEHLPYHVTDLGEAWKEFTGEKMVYALWVVRKSDSNDQSCKIDEVRNILLKSKTMGLSQIPAIIAKAREKTGLPLPVIEEYFATNSYDFDESCRRALLVYYDYAYKSGLIDERAKLHVWGESGE
ncbi:MAG: menaquinone biosynthesis protein [Desulfotomaculaceae bacterium]|nr:menaquinone biosynthesis protein [Desulfotomaculaceae bacterium]